MDFKDTTLYKTALKNISNLNKIWLFKTNYSGDELVAINNEYDNKIILILKFELINNLSYIDVFVPKNENIYNEEVNLNNDFTLLNRIEYKDNNTNPIQEVVYFLIYINSKHKFSKKYIDSNLEIINKLKWFNK